MCRDKKITLQIIWTKREQRKVYTCNDYIIYVPKCWISDADFKIRAHLLTKQLGQSFSQPEIGQFPW